MGIFAAIGKIIIESKDALEHLAKTIDSYHEFESNKRTQEAKAELKAKVSLPVEVTDYYSSEQIERPVKNRREQIRFKLEICGLVIAVALAGITFKTLLAIHGQLSEMRRQTRQSLESFRIDERASIGIESMKLKYAEPVSTTTAAVAYEVTAKNFGKTVARDIVLKKVTAMDANTDEAIKRRMVQNALRGIPPVDAFPESLGPSVHIAIPFSVGGSAPQTYGEGAKRTVWRDYLIGRIDYVDAFRVPHWMTFCFVVTDAKGNIGYCETGNDEDRNPKLPPN